MYNTYIIAQIEKQEPLPVKQMTKSIVGDLIGRRNIVYAPVNRAGVLLLFARLLDEFDMLVEETAEDSSYVIARRRVDDGWERVKVNFAFKSSGFQNGNFSEEQLLICWNHDWHDCPLKVFELRSLFMQEDATAPITRPQEEPPVNVRINPTRVATFSDIIPENPGEILLGKNITEKRFEKAIGDLDEKIKNFFPEKT